MESTFSISGQFVTQDVVASRKVTVDSKSGLITSVQSYSKNASLIIPEEKLIFLGFLDVHTHGRQDVSGKECYKEDFSSLGRAAANGGVVHVAEMGNNPVPPVDDESYKAKVALTESSIVPVTLYAMMGPNTRPLKSIDVPYKCCLARTTGANDTIFFPNREAIEETSARYVGKHTSYHAEDHAILEINKHHDTHEKRRPPEAEVSAVDFALYLIEKYAGEGKICHCSVVSGLKKIASAKERGVKVVSEITPHHLYFDQTMITPENRQMMQMNPPLRSESDRLNCIRALLTGIIDMIATDHAPHTAGEKMKGASGQPHLDTLGAFITWLMKEHQFSPWGIARICNYNPAKFLNRFLDPRVYGKGYGKLAEGYVGSFTIIDPNNPILITRDKLETKCGWSPFEGITFPGRVDYTIVRGKVLKEP